LNLNTKEAAWELPDSIADIVRNLMDEAHEKRSDLDHEEERSQVDQVIEHRTELFRANKRGRDENMDEDTNEEVETLEGAAFWKLELTPEQIRCSQGEAPGELSGPYARSDGYQTEKKREKILLVIPRRIRTKAREVLNSSTKTSVQYRLKWFRNFFTGADRLPCIAEPNWPAPYATTTFSFGRFGLPLTRIQRECRARCSWR
jgi:hypothetical protein